MAGREEVGINIEPGEPSEKDHMLKQGDTKAGHNRPFDASVSIHRDAQTYQSMVDTFQLQWEPTNSVAERVKSGISSQCRCSGDCLKDRVLGFLPFISVLQNYDWKAWLLFDFIAGISVGVIHIPQGMGFALLTSVPPVYGLYSSVFPVFLYFFFGTSRHISMGTMALISLMIGAVVNREMEKAGLSTDPAVFGANLTANETADLIAIAERYQVDIAVSVSLMVGVIQFLMGLVGLGVIASFMSMPFVGSFLAGAAVHIIMSQIPSLLGLKMKRRVGLFIVPLTIYDICAHITETNLCALITGGICLVLLFVLKEVINEKFKSRLKVPIPAELIIIVLGTIVSHFSHLDDKYGLRIVGPIPNGIPAPRVPPMTNAATYVTDSFLIAIISFAISISMCKLMAGKHKYKINMNQELFAYGISHGIGAFFNCFAGAQAPPRTLVHDSVGGKTQVGSLVSCVLLLLVCLVMGPLFQSLPITVLAAIIIVALLPLFRQFKTLPGMGRVSSPDLIVWIATFTAVVLLNLTIGLVMGIATSILVVIILDKMASGDTLVSVDNSEVYLPSDGLLPSANFSEIPRVKIFRFQTALYFVNVEKFKMELFQKTVNCQQLAIDRAQAANQNEDEVIDIVEVNSGAANREADTRQPPNNNPDDGKLKCFLTDDVGTIIIDCSLISYIDLMGVNMLKTLVGSYSDVGINMVVANCNKSVWAKLHAADLVKTEGGQTSKLEVFPLVQDAVAAATCTKTE